MNEENKRQTIALFERLQCEFPHLAMEFDLNDAHLDVCLTIPRQPGLSFEACLNLQNDDELFLCVGGFFCSWFPMSKQTVLDSYYDAVVGVLSGKYRVIEYVRRGRVVGADLQVPAGERWRTIARSRGGLLPVSWYSQQKVLVNSEPR